MLVIQAVPKIAGHSPGAVTNKEPGNQPQSLCVDFHWLAHCSCGIMHNEAAIIEKCHNWQPPVSSNNLWVSLRSSKVYIAWCIYYPHSTVFAPCRVTSLAFHSLFPSKLLIRCQYPQSKLIAVTLGLFLLATWHASDGGLLLMQSMIGHLL